MGATPGRACSAWRRRCPSCVGRGRDRPARLGRRSPSGCRARPARIAGLAGHGHDPAPGRAGQPHPGRPDRPAHRRPGRRWPAAAATRPYAGLELPGRVVATFLRGEPTVLDGKARDTSELAAASEAETRTGDPRPRGRADVPRRGVRRGRGDLRRGGLHHRHDRLPGDADRPVATTGRSWCRPRRTSATPASTTRTTSPAGSGSPATSCATRPAARPTGGPPAAWTTSWSTQGVVGISGIDTRALTRHLRERGAMRVGHQQRASPTPTRCCARVRRRRSMVGADLAPR